LMMGKISHGSGKNCRLFGSERLRELWRWKSMMKIHLKAV